MKEPVTIELALTVSEFIKALNACLRPIEAIVQGEVTQIKERGAAVYFTLSDKHEKATLNCVVWQNRLKSRGITLKEGMEVKISGYAEVYAPFGRLSLMAEYIIPLGEGALKQAYEKLKRELELAGYFAPERKRSLPPYINRIGLITSEKGEATQDFQKHIGNHGYKIYFKDVRVEGIKAAESIVNAIKWFNENTNGIEVLVITRGGGSLEALQAFNTLEVAKAIFSSKIPIMTAIGHENDFTIADFVADVRASVPTHAGKLIGDPWESAGEKIDAVEENIISHFRNKLRVLENSLNNYQSGFLSSYQRFLTQGFRDLNSYQNSLWRCFNDLLGEIKKVEKEFSYNYERFYRLQLKTKEIIDNLENGITNEAGKWFRYLTGKIGENEKLLFLSDPQLKLKQGFSITKDRAGRVIKSAGQTKIGDIISVQLYKGSLSSKVEEIK